VIKVSDIVKNKTVKFCYYRQGNLLYRTEDGFVFPVPISDTNDASFPAEGKAIEFMRWIRKQVDIVNSQEKISKIIGGS
jgi:hypothetical protein